MLGCYYIWKVHSQLISPLLYNLDPSDQLLSTERLRTRYEDAFRLSAVSFISLSTVIDVIYKDVAQDVGTTERNVKK